MTPKFVTCNYTNLYGSRFNGRLNRDQTYMYSLRSIAECGDLIVNYTCPYNREFVDPYLEQQGIKNVLSVDFDLRLSPYHARVEEIKDKNEFYYTDLSWLNRCVEIMWGKFEWLAQQGELLEDDDCIYWVDSGLSHGGAIPRLFNTFHENPAYYNPDKPDEMLLEYAHRHDRIFNKDFSKRLDAYVGDQIVLITSCNNQHGDKLGFEFHNTLHEWPIGGLFGGKKKHMLPFIAEFRRLAQRVMESDLLVKEEQIMAVILCEHPDWFKTFQFDTWYHPDWEQYGVWNPSMKGFYRFFELINNIKIGIN
jgi:hypothetical protein